MRIDKYLTEKKFKKRQKCIMGSDFWGFKNNLISKFIKIQYQKTSPQTESFTETKAAWNQNATRRFSIKHNAGKDIRGSYKFALKIHLVSRSRVYRVTLWVKSCIREDTYTDRSRVCEGTYTSESRVCEGTLQLKVVSKKIPWSRNLYPRRYLYG